MHTYHLGIIASSQQQDTGPVLAIFDPAYAEANVIISADGLTVGYGGEEVTAAASVPYGKKTGKHYFEVTEIQTTVSVNVFTSVGLARVDQTDMASQFALGVNQYINSGGSRNLFIDKAAPVNFTSSVSGDVWCFALDLTAGLAWVRKNNGNWNGSGTANPATAVGGLSLRDLTGMAIAPFVSFRKRGDAVKFNFGQNTFAQAVPSGFTAGWLATTPEDNTGLGVTTLACSTNVFITLSNANKTATRLGGNAMAFSPDPHRSGKYYFEVTTNLLASASDGIGIAEPDATYINVGTSGVKFAGIYASSGNIWSNGASSGVSLGAIASGNRIDVAADLDAKLIWFRKNGGNWNNNVGANPALGTLGISFSSYVHGMTPTFSLAGAGSVGKSVTVAQSSFVGTVPGGFAGWPRSVSTPFAAAALESLWVGGLS